MKIAFLFGSMARGGAERVISHLSNAFVRQRDEVSIITMDRSTSGYLLDERVRHIRLDVAGKSANIIQGVLRNMKSNRALKKHMDEERYDVVVSFQIRTAISLLAIHPFHRTYKVVASERANPQVAPRTSALEKVLRKRMLNRVDGFIFQTEKVSLCYSEKLRKIGTVIPNGVFGETLPDVVPFEKREPMKVVAVGRLVRQKGYDLLVDAIAEAVKVFPQLSLHIYGVGPLEAEIRHQAKQLNIAEQIVLHGSVPSTPEVIKDASMFVLASRFEGMPNALMEAMACGLPCVAADCDFGPCELIEDHVNGLLVPVEDADALAKAVTEILEDRKLAKQLATKAEEIRKTHSGDRIAMLYRDYILKVTSTN